MMTLWGDLESTVAFFDDFRRRMDRVFDDVQSTRGRGVERYLGGSAPRASVRDTGTALVVTAELPGLAEGDVQITANEEGLTLSGERKVAAPEGWAVHRQERAGFKFSRSFTFPCKVDAEKATASLKNGLLTLTVPKAPEAQPRRIAVQAG